MSNQSNPSAQIISLPKGGGALSGIGEKFSPDLHTGTGNFTVPIAIPPGRNGFQPQLSLVYSTGNGNGLFGLGWNLSIPGIVRKTSHGLPRYNERTTESQLEPGELHDVFILSGAEDLVPVSGGYPGHKVYRPRTEGLFARIEHVSEGTGDYWRVSSKDGLISRYGTPAPALPISGWSDPAALRDPTKKSRIFAWKLTETRDPFGNLIRYEYVRDQGGGPGEPHRWDQPLLQAIRYADYSDPARPEFLVHVELEYEDRPDPFSDYRAGFEIRTTKRCRAIRVRSREIDGTSHAVREYRFVYQADPHNGQTLLTSFVVIGFDDSGIPSSDLPPLTFGYTAFRPEHRRFKPVGGIDLPAQDFSDPNLELLDLHGSGLPDILELNGSVRYWRNLGDGKFDLPRPMADAPAHALADPGVQIIDANGDGRPDLLVTSPPLGGYYPLTFNASWSRSSFQAYAVAPTFSLDDPEVRLVDLDGDGITDILRSGSRLEHWFNHSDRELAWQRPPVFASRQDLETFPDVAFSDPRVKLADLNGDGLQDILLIHDGNLEYWPNIGHGRWARRISMRHAPRYRDPGYSLGYDPRRILVGDVDGDGLADIVYVGHGSVQLWLNQSGNAWSEEPFVIEGTPPVTDLDNVRLVDLYGNGVSGVLWTADATGFDRNRMLFLDFTGGKKPYLLHEMDNHMGAITRVEYRPSTHYFLQDQQQPATRWRAPLPFPVQVVARVEAIDDISKGKLASEYRYHHGFWDGAEREFRGFGMVEQLDTESIEAYHESILHGDADFIRFLNTALAGHFSPPTLTKTWFHQGPVGEEYGDWSEADYAHEYWPDDPHLLGHTIRVNDFLKNYNDRPNDLPSPRNRRIKRDALRSLRGSILRTELYALDGSARESRPYTVSEHAYGLKEIDAPADTHDNKRTRIFFPHLAAQRTTQWERGDDPLTQFTLIDDYDAFGQPARQTAVAMPRRADTRRSIPAAVVGSVQPDESKVLATHTHTTYARPPVGRYMHNRIAQAKSYELAAPPSAPDAVGDDTRTVLRKQWTEAQRVRDVFKSAQANTLKVFGHSVHHYDGAAFDGLPPGHLGPYGAPVRTETLVFTDRILEDAYADPGGSRRPTYLGGTAALPSNAPASFGSGAGYRQVTAAPAGCENGWYADTHRQAFDFQTGVVRPRGLVLTMRDALGNDTTVAYDAHDLLPIRVTDAVGLQTTARYNYRALQPESLTDPNGTRTHMRYTPIGLPERQFVRGLDEQGNESLGGTEAKPEILFEYDFLHYQRSRLATGQGQPVYVHTKRRIHHASDDLSDEIIESREYSDGYGRLAQTRTQAEDWVFGTTGDDVGLAAEAGVALRPALGQKRADAVVVSGWQVYDNKGRVIEKYEPFFAHDWAFQGEQDARRGRHATMFYDPRGAVIHTLNPDGCHQRVVLGAPINPTTLSLGADDLTSTDVPKGFEPTPWETYSYDGNDLAPLSVDENNATLAGRAQTSHHFTPASTIIDALGRTLCQVQRNGAAPAQDWHITRTDYDLRGNALVVHDAHGRKAFEHVYDLLNRALRVDSIDAGLRTSVLDAQGSLIEYRSSKGSLAVRIYDNLNRLKQLWARNDAGGGFSLRERIEYGDEGDRDAAMAKHRLGRPVKHYDEAGLLETLEYDFKGNLIEKSRATIQDTVISAGWQAEWEKPDADASLESTAYRTSSRYDALNRPVELTYPQGVDGERRKLKPRYNRAGALEGVALGADDYVKHIAYNAKRQRLLVLYGNGVMTRHVYDLKTFRLARLRTERSSLTTDAASGSMTAAGLGPALQDFIYRYDLAGNVTSIDERVPNSGVINSPQGRDRLLREFDYDPIYRLISATGRACKDIGIPRGLDDDPRCGFFSGASSTVTQDNAPELTEPYTETYRYDPTGNMLELSYQAASGSWKRVFGMGNLPADQWPQASNNQLTSLVNGSINYAYGFDANGNLIRQNSERHHAWDHSDRMIGYTVRPGSGQASIEARYLYGSDGMRVKKWVRNQQGKVNTTVYVDGAFELHSETDASATRENNTLHVMDDRNRIAMLWVGSSLNDRDALPRVQYHLGDHIGNSATVIGGDHAQDATFINREEYHPFGETSFGSYGQKRYRFSGKERDEESGFNYVGARFYISWLLRWSSCDPLGVTSGINSYEFVANSPFCIIDPTGTQAVPTHQEQSAQQSLVETDQVCGVDLEAEGVEVNSANSSDYNSSQSITLSPADRFIPPTSIQAPNKRDLRVSRMLEGSLYYQNLLRTITDPEVYEIQPIGPLREQLDAHVASVRQRVDAEMQEEQLIKELGPGGIALLQIIKQHRELGTVLVAGVVPRNSNRQPQFESFHDVQLAPSLVMASDDQQFRFALDDLRKHLANNPGDRKNFTPQQLKDIASGRRGRTQLFVWHHSDVDVFVLHFVDRRTHAEPTNRHIGSTSLTQRDRRRGGIRK